MGSSSKQSGVRARAGVGGGEQNAAELDSASLTARQRPQRLGQNPLRQTETRADPTCLAFGGVPAERREPLLELAVAAYRFVTGGIVGDLGHERLLLLKVGEQRVEPARREHPIPGQHVEVALLGILWQVTDFPAAHDGACVRLALTGQDPHGGGLASAVSADQPDAIAGLHAQRRAVSGQQCARPGADLEVRCGDHAALLFITCRR